MVLWGIFLFITASNGLKRIDAGVSTNYDTGDTFLIAGSDARGDKGGVSDDGTEGGRTDSMMLVHKAANDTSQVVSLPRDSFVEIPDNGNNKLNAAYSFGGAPLLTQTVENLTGLQVNHFVLVRMGAVSQIVDALGGVELCLDFDVNDERSELVWQKGCHQVDGKTALAFSRMRYGDPRGDLGRQDRQRQVLSKIVQKATSAGTILNPGKQLALVRAATGSLEVDRNTSLVDLMKMALSYRSASKDKLSGIPPIKDLDYRGGHGSSVLLDPKEAPVFFNRVMKGEIKPEDFNRLTGNE
ncbi:hypothetical protein BK816_03280 [Boudabousia tangfeifanii]|uniref:Cell envelope-related transcriptional attenuator domain-containing protein n=1 Tax=Boudabousia tangfeifanii TaxID=1912795 RepID=A0A1D9MMH3_9ACTO|nr:hypothetical protein BK816_03280 [Boudabousia tangfeifanii]